MSIITPILFVVGGFILGFATRPKLATIVNAARTKLAQKIAPKS